MRSLTRTNTNRSDPVSQYLTGIDVSKSWSRPTQAALDRAIANNPYGVYAAVSKQLLGDRKIDSRKKMLENGGTTDRVGRGTVLENIRNLTWGAIFTAAATHSEAKIRSVVTSAGAKTDPAFQPKIDSWTNSAGNRITGPVFTWERWSGKAWVDK